MKNLVPFYAFILQSGQGTGLSVQKEEETEVFLILKIIAYFRKMNPHYP